MSTSQARFRILRYLIAMFAGAAAGLAATISSWLTIPANAIHLGAVAIWFGGLLLLLLAPGEPPGGSPDGHFGEVLRAVSGAALLAVVLIAHKLHEVLALSTRKIWW